MHTFRWAKSLKNNNFDVLLFSFFKPNKNSKKLYNKLDINIVTPDLRYKIKSLHKPNLSKLTYILSLSLLKKTIKKFKPTILHAHYASSYGFIAFLTRFKPFFVSVWGSDIYDFPNRSFLNNQLIKITIKSASEICSTSKAMKKIIEQKYKIFNVNVVPFGIDVEYFKPKNNQNTPFTVGTIKSIEAHNGIDCLLEAARIVVKEYHKQINFIIVGTGTLLDEMKKKAIELKIHKNVKFTGFVEHKKVLGYYQKISIFVAVSRIESFGVSVLEASSCEVPSITSNVGGLKEVNLHNYTGIVIKKDNPRQLADSIIRLYSDEFLRKKMSKNARKHVEKNFNWNENTRQMLSIYKKYLSI